MYSGAYDEVYIQMSKFKALGNVVAVKTDGLKKPLEVQKTNKGYVVEVGNQRLQALLDLGITTSPCIVKGE